MIKRTFIVAAMVMLTQLLIAQDLADLFENNKHSVVTLYVSESLSTGAGDPRTFASSMGLGSGVLIREDMVLTAAHVVGNAEEIMVQFFDGEAISAKTIRISKNADVAVIQLDRAPGNPRVAVIGNSGGPMFNYRGEVIGVVSSILTRSGGFEGIGFAATSEVARSLLSSRSSKFFGIDAMVLPYEYARLLNIPQESGLLVQHVVKESPAGVAGLKGGFRMVVIDEEEILLGGDVILSIDQIVIRGEVSASELFDHLDAVDATVKHKLTVLRAGEIIDLYWISTDIN